MCIRDRYEYIATPYLRSMQWYVPGGFLAEYRNVIRPFLDKSLVGEQGAQQALEEGSAKANALLKKWQDQLNAGDVKR